MPDPTEVVENSDTPQNTPPPETTAPPQETVETPPQAQEEDFLEGSEFDSRTLPPSLQGAYKGMQGAFTRKNQALSEKFKDYDQIKGELSQYVTLFGDPEISARLAVLRTGGQGGGAVQQGGQVQEPRYMTEEQMIAYFGAKDAITNFMTTYGQEAYVKNKFAIDAIAASFQGTRVSPAERLNKAVEALGLKPLAEAGKETVNDDKKPDPSQRKGPDRGKGGSVPQPKTSGKGLTKEEKFQAAADETKAELGMAE